MLCLGTGCSRAQEVFVKFPARGYTPRGENGQLPLTKCSRPARENTGRERGVTPRLQESRSRDRDRMTPLFRDTHLSYVRRVRSRTSSGL